MKSEDEFVIQVAEAIVKNHNKEIKNTTFDVTWVGTSSQTYTLVDELSKSNWSTLLEAVLFTL